MESAATFPDLPALHVNGQTLSYSELSDLARGIAAALRADCPGPLERVGILASRSVTGYAGSLGALFSGAAFVPLNPGYPIARTRAMANRAQLNAIVVDRKSAVQLPEILAGLTGSPTIVTADPEARDALLAAGISTLDAEEFAPLAELPPVLLDDLAYLLFTSGSTGEPKGVGVTHSNVLHYLSVVQERVRLSPADRCSLTFDQTFDLSVHDQFLAWGAGASVFAMQPIELLAPVRFVRRHGLTVWFSVPSVAALALKKGMLQPGTMPSLRHSMFCGEPLPDTSARAWQAAAPDSVIDNLYGPTEATIACFGYRWRADRSSAEAVNGVVRLGRPFPGIGACVVDECLKEVPAGEAGELLVCGPQTVPGYWRDEARTDERFIRLAISPTRELRFYRTGDRVMRTETGDYAFLGRVDHQIKVLGYRVELGEIEAVLMRECGAVQAIAAGWPVEDGRALGIVAFVTGATVSPETMIRISRDALPAYMVPSRVLVLDAMPLNANGKIERRQLVDGLEQLAVA